MKRALLFALAVFPLLLSVLIIGLNFPEKSQTEIKATADVVLPEDINTKWSLVKESSSETFAEVLKKCNPNFLPQKYYIENSAPEIRTLAIELTKDSKTELEKVEKLYNFVSENVTYKVYDDWRSATNVLFSKEGDCTDKSILLVSLLQSSGIESYVLYSEKNAQDYSHAWVVAKISNYWLQIDPTTADIFSVYSCLNKEECNEKSYYNNVAGMFNEEKSFEC